MQPEVEPTPCPGLYCGWTQDATGNFSICGTCPTGFRANEATSVCEECEGEPTLYDWLFLGFMAMLAPALHWFFIDFTNRKKSGKLLILHGSAFVESVAATVFTLLVSRPIGQFTITSCPVRRLSDWYTMLQNPSPDYTSTLHCTQEAVYPLYTIVMIYYAFCLLCMILVRPLLSAKCVNRRGTKSIYAALYFLPMLVVTQAVLAGLLYYAFPYIVLTVSVVTMAIHLAYFNNQGIKNLLRLNFTTPRNLTIVLGHWLLHAYGIVAVTQMATPSLHAPLICLVPFPTLFYIATVKFTNPSQLEAA